MAKHMRLPNGFGQISKIKKPLRNPYRAMISTGINPDTGHHIQKTIGYYRTYNDAYQALMEYHNKPYETLNGSILLKDLHDRWFKEWEPTHSANTIESYNIAWRRCSCVQNIKIRDIRPAHIKEAMDQAPTAATKQNVKVLFNVMLDYALEYGLVEHNYARNFAGCDTHAVAKPHMAFTDEEISILWKHTDDTSVQQILIQMYMGWRPQELCNLLIKNVNIQDWTITGGMKTKNGTDRVIPIPEKIKGFVEAAYDPNQSFLMRGVTGKKMNYDNYARCFDIVIDKYKLNTQHRPHDPRKTFVTLAKRKGVDEYAIKRIVGHAIADITERVYTERDIEWLREQINII